MTRKRKKSKKRISPLMRLWNNLRKASSAVCNKTGTKAKRTKAEKKYVDAAVKKGQKRAEAQRKANKAKKC